MNKNIAKCLALALFMLLAITGCANKNPTKCSSLEWGYDVSKCGEWRICGLPITDEGVTCTTYTDFDEVKAFCERFDFLTGECDHERYTYRIDCMEPEDGFIMC